MSEKVCVITGGTRGIGFSTVQAFLNDGYRVILYGSREATVSKALSELEGQKVEAAGPALTMPRRSPKTLPKSRKNTDRSMY